MVDRRKQKVMGARDAAVAFETRPIVVRAPGAEGVAVTAGTVERTLLPPERMDVRLTLLGVKELVYIRENRHGCTSPVVRNPGTERERLISSARFPLATNSDKLSEEISWGRG
jgi:hypothetical protein